MSAFIAVSLFVMGWSLGATITTLKYEEQYMWRFSRYSVMMRSLAERQEISALTNAVILFDTRFNPKRDPQDLADVLVEILQDDPSWDAVETNTATIPPPGT